MSRPRKKVEEPEIIEEPVQEQNDETEPTIEVEEPVAEVSSTNVEEPVTEVVSTDIEDKMAVLERARRDIEEHSRRRPGSVSGMMPPAYRLTISGGRVRYFTLPINVEECAVESNWKRCKPFMTPEEYIAFLIQVLKITPPPFYSSFRVISIE